MRNRIDDYDDDDDGWGRKVYIDFYVGTFLLGNHFCYFTLNNKILVISLSISYEIAMCCFFTSPRGEKVFFF